MQIKELFIDSPTGGLLAQSTIEGIKSLRFLTNEQSSVMPKKSNCPFLNQLKTELELYFLGKLYAFSVPLVIEGTEFQKKVWNELMKVPYAETISYKTLASRIQAPKSTRAVGMASGKNKILIVIPCHRMIGLNGNLVGFVAGIDKKKWLIDRENASKKDEWM